MSAVAERVPARAATRPRRALAGVRRRPRSAWWDRLEYAGLRTAAGVLGALPLGVALRLGALGALVGYVCDPVHRRVGMRNLGIAFPEKPLRERRRILRR